MNIEHSLERKTFGCLAAGIILLVSGAACTTVAAPSRAVSKYIEFQKEDPSGYFNKSEAIYCGTTVSCLGILSQTFGIMLVYCGSRIQRKPKSNG